MPENIEDIAEISVEIAKENSEKSGGPKWIDYSALSTMVMAMILAITALFAGISANEALIYRLNENADLIKASQAVLEQKIFLNRDALHMERMAPKISDLQEEIPDLGEQENELLLRAPEDLKISNESLHTHEIFAIGVTVLSVAISMTGMAIAIRRKYLWYVALMFALVSFVIITSGFLQYFGQTA